MDLEQLCCLSTWNAVLLWTSSINRAGHRAIQLIWIGVNTCRKSRTSSRTCRTDTKSRKSRKSGKSGKSGGDRGGRKARKSKPKYKPKPKKKLRGGIISTPQKFKELFCDRNTHELYVDPIIFPNGLSYSFRDKGVYIFPSGRSIACEGAMKSKHVLQNRLLKEIVDGVKIDDNNIISVVRINNSTTSFNQPLHASWYHGCQNRNDRLDFFFGLVIWRFSDELRWKKSESEWLTRLFFICCEVEVRIRSE